MGEPTVRNTLRVQRAMRDLTQADLLSGDERLEDGDVTTDALR